MDYCAFSRENWKTFSFYKIRLGCYTDNVFWDRHQTTFYVITCPMKKLRMQTVVLMKHTVTRTKPDNADY